MWSPVPPRWFCINLLYLVHVHHSPDSELSCRSHENAMPHSSLDPASLTTFDQLLQQRSCRSGLACGRRLACCPSLDEIPQPPALLTAKPRWSFPAPLLVKLARKQRRDRWWTPMGKRCQSRPLTMLSQRLALVTVGIAFFVVTIFHTPPCKPATSHVHQLAQAVLALATYKRSAKAFVILLVAGGH